MTYISPENEQRIKQLSQDKLLEVIGNSIQLTPTSRTKKTYIGQCPVCKSEKGLLVTPDKQMFGCKDCRNCSGKYPLDFLYRQGIPYHECLRQLAEILNIVIVEPTVNNNSKRKTGKNNTSAPAKKNFLKEFLSGSGLTAKDVEIKVRTKDENRTVIQSPVFRSGTMDYSGNIDKTVDDVVIEYYDLEGAPVMYEVKDKRKKLEKKEYARVRYQFPQEHTDKNGRPIKYRTPAGAGTALYIPQKIRELYTNGTKIDRIFIQEGEKKAEKACKHGIHSVGISGIQNFAYQGQVPPDLVKLIQKCEIREIVLLFDSDWNDISSTIGINDDAMQRPRNFLYAARNFKKYVETLRNRNIYLDIYIGHVLENENKDKGIDDLLVNTLKDNPDILLQDINTLINKKNLDGEYLQLYKITIMGDLALQELWSLQSPQAFAERHKEKLKELPEFRIGKHSWRFNESGELENTRPLEHDEQYWRVNVKHNKDGEKTGETYEFRYVPCMRFLERRGFGRYWKSDKDRIFIHVTPPTVKVVDHTEIRDYIDDFTKALKDEEVLEMLFRGGSQYLGPDKLSRLEFQYPNFEVPRRDSQLLYFKDFCWKVTVDGIEVLDYTQISHMIWSDQVKDFAAQREDKPLIQVTKDENGNFDYTLSEAGQKCHMLQFLINTSNFTWRKEQAIKEGDNSEKKLEIDLTELQENKTHLISKLCAIGYMLMSCKDQNVSRAVVAMDGKLSEVGRSNGRSGKSVLGVMFRNLIPTVYINGKQENLEKDQFLWTEIEEKTKAVFLDDVRTNFSLEFLFACITGDWAVNYKGEGRRTFPFSKSPKIYITTNHALNGEGSSFNDRQWLIAFSDFYSDTHKPIHDFGCLFFDEWGFQQWNLLYNLIAECIQLYLRFGVVQAPGERLEARRLRQMIGTQLEQWADEYFSDSAHMNTKLVRKVVYDNFKQTLTGKEIGYYSATSFKKKLLLYIEYKGYKFNPHRYDNKTGEPRYYDKDGNPIIDHKEGGVEYFTIGDENFYKQEPTQTTVPFDKENDIDQEDNGDYIY